MLVDRDTNRPCRDFPDLCSFQAASRGRPDACLTV